MGPRTSPTSLGLTFPLALNPSSVTGNAGDLPRSTDYPLRRYLGAALNIYELTYVLAPEEADDLYPYSQSGRVVYPFGESRHRTPLHSPSYLVHCGRDPTR